MRFKRKLLCNNSRNSTPHSKVSLKKFRTMENDNESPGSQWEVPWPELTKEDLDKYAYGSTIRGEYVKVAIFPPRSDSEEEHVVKKKKSLLKKAHEDPPPTKKRTDVLWYYGKVEEVRTRIYPGTNRDQFLHYIRFNDNDFIPVDVASFERNNALIFLKKKPDSRKISEPLGSKEVCYENERGDPRIELKTAMKKKAAKSSIHPSAAKTDWAIYADRHNIAKNSSDGKFIPKHAKKNNDNINEEVPIQPQAITTEDMLKCMQMMSAIASMAHNPNPGMVFQQVPIDDGDKKRKAKDVTMDAPVAPPKKKARQMVATTIKKKSPKKNVRDENDSSSEELSETSKGQNKNKGSDDASSASSNKSGDDSKKKTEIKKNHGRNKSEKKSMGAPVANTKKDHGKKDKGEEESDENKKSKDASVIEEEKVNNKNSNDDDDSSSEATSDKSVKKKKHNEEIHNNSMDKSMSDAKKDDGKKEEADGEKKKKAQSMIETQIESGDSNNGDNDSPNSSEQESDSSEGNNGDDHDDDGEDEGETGEV